MRPFRTAGASADVAGATHAAAPAATAAPRTERRPMFMSPRQAETGAVICRTFAAGLRTPADVPDWSVPVALRYARTRVTASALPGDDRLFPRVRQAWPPERMLPLHNDYLISRHQSVDGLYPSRR